MKLTTILLATLLLLAGCTKQPESPSEGGSIDLSRFASASLSTISVEGGGVVTARSGGSDATTRAADTPIPLSVGQTFRLYAFAKGVTDINKAITTRTYTIATADGAPVMDADQDPLYLPLGEVDIFLVGPVSADLNAGLTDPTGNPLPPQVVNVAADYGVFPQHGVDLIASKTEITVQANTDNIIAPNALRHKMAKLEVVVQRPIDAHYQNMSVNTIQLKNQSLTGEYTFGVDGGAVTPADEGNATLEPTIIEQTKGETYLISELMIPRKDVYMKVGVFFVCNVEGEDDLVSRRMESGTLKYPLVAGQNNRFVTKPNISSDLLFRYRLLPWDEVAMPEEDIHPNEAVLFSYSGADAPVERGGKRYWLDRSGNGRDAELVGNVQYNATEKYYYTTDVTSYIRVPDLGDVPVYTLELMATSEFASAANPVTFYNSSDESHASGSLTVNLPRDATNTIAFYAKRNVGTELARDIYPSDKAYLENIATWAFAKNTTTMSIRRNGVAVGAALDITGKQAHGGFNNNKLLKWSGNGPSWTARPIKLYGARMSSSYLPDEALKQNHRNDMLVVKQIDINRGYVDDGLILDLRGDVAPSTVNGKSVWKDLSGMENHAEIVGATYVAGENCYSLVAAGYLKLIRSLGTNQNYTVEMVMQPPGPSLTCTLHFTSVDNQVAYRELSMHYPYNNGNFYVDTPLNNGRGSINRIEQRMTTLPYAVNSKHQLSIARTANVAQGISMRSCGKLVTNSVATYTPLNEMKFCYIGCFSDKTAHWAGKIFALRVYNRVLTEAERQVNYQVDKEKYNLLP